ncbi:chemotaxis response regulator CheY [Deferrisoma camini]|uniref:chemotaxis response regulator CheY n=1 Tax=Deferrisoma camini TaxID=1035120 RepID=UPI00046D8DD0|nr:chemotaxis response regulator CheY [Deferrisoma camini]
MKILTVDDSSTMRRIIKNTLNRLGYTDVVEAEHGVDALAKMAGVGLVLTDWNMPEMDGLTFVKALRSNPQYKEIPIIMVTTEAAKKEILEAIKAGVTDYIVKPFTPDTLKEKIERVLAA